MSKLYAIKLNTRNLHKNNLGQIVYFTNKSDVRLYMKHNHYDGVIQELNISLEKDAKISDLEAKLAESEEKYKKAYQEGLLQKQFDKDAEIMQLKQQLAEKEKEIEEFKKPQLVFKNKLDIEELKKQLGAEPFVVIGLDTSEVKMSSPNQDKIELLEKVKKLFEEKYSYDVEESEFAVVYEDDIDEIIDNQIKVLKEGK